MAKYYKKHYKGIKATEHFTKTEINAVLHFAMNNGYLFLKNPTKKRFEIEFSNLREMLERYKNEKIRRMPLTSLAQKQIVFSV